MGKINLNPFPLGRVVGTPEIIDEDFLLESFGFRVGGHLDRAVVPDDSDTFDLGIAKFVGGFSVTAAEPDITRVDPRMLDRFEREEERERKARLIADRAYREARQRY